MEPPPTTKPVPGAQPSLSGLTPTPSIPHNLPPSDDEGPMKGSRTAAGPSQDDCAEAKGAGNDSATNVLDNLDQPAKREDHLCTTLCDLFFSLPKKWIFKRSLELIADFEKCYENDVYEDKKGIVYFDLRGRYADEVKKVLIGNLSNWTHPPLCVKYIVGCKVHGVGEGTLMNAIIGLLRRGNIKWDKECGGSIISIQLGGKNLEVDRLWRISIKSPHEDVQPIFPFIFSNATNAMRSGEEEVQCEDESAGTELGISKDCVEDEEITSETATCWATRTGYKMRPLCIVACDMLFGFGRPLDQPYDENMIKRVMSGLAMCHKDYSDKCKEGTHIVDLRGWFVEEAIRKLVEHLNSLATKTGYLYVRVGCEKHGIGEGKLKRAIIALLTSEGTIEFNKDDSVSIVSITLDGRESYSILGEVSDELFYSDEDFSLPSYSDIEDSHEEVSNYTITYIPYQSQDEKMSGRVR